MKVFVTGGNGFIGSRVVHTLLAYGESVRCLLRPSSDLSRIKDLPYEKHVGDLQDFDSLRDGMSGCDAVIHLAAVSAWKDIQSPALDRIVVEGSRDIFEASFSSRIRCVYISSAAAINASRKPVIFNEESPFELAGSPLRYAQAKHQAEEVARDYCERGADIVTVNPVEVYGPDDTELITACNIRDILTTPVPMAFSGGTGIAHVDDVADGIVRALRHGRAGERYILGGTNMTIRQIVNLTLYLAGITKRVVTLPGTPLKWILKAAAALRLPTPIVPEVMDYATKFFFVDSSKAEKELGYRFRAAPEVLLPVIQWLKKSELVP